MKRRHLNCLLGFLLGMTIVLAAQPAPISAVESGTPQGAESISLPQISGPFYLALNVPKSRFYLGEKSVISLVLYINSRYVNNVEIDKPILTHPQFKLDLVSNYVRDLVVNNDPFQTIYFQYRVTPLKTGRFNLGPFRLNFPVVLKDAYSKKAVMELSSNKTVVNIVGLPMANRPANFSGGVGSFHVVVNTASYQVLQGEPLKVTLKVAGNGDLTAISPPYLQSEIDLKVFDAQKRADLSSHNNLYEQAVFEQVLIPTGTSRKQIGPYLFSFFNPETGTYQTLRSAAIPVSIKPNPNFKDSAAGMVKIKPAQLAPLKASLGIGWSQKYTVFYLGCLFFVGLLAIIVLIWAALYRRNRDLLQSDTPKARAIRAATKAQAQLASTKTRLNDGNTSEILDNLHLILREFLGERFNLAVAGMTSTVTHSLAKHGLADEILAEIKDFFERYDQHCFAGTKITTAEAEQIQEQVERIITGIDGLDV